MAGGNRSSGVVPGVLLLAGAAVAVAAAVAMWSTPDDTSPAPAVATMTPGPTAGPGWRLWAVRDDGSPVRWDPCSEIAWTVRAGDPAWLSPVVGQVLDRVTAATGLRFRRVPPRDTAVGSDRPLASDGAWEPVVVTFTTPSETDWLTDADRAVTVPVAVDGQFVTGQVLLHDGRELTADLASRDGSWGGVLLHEVGHLVGLDHVEDPAQVLHPVPREGPVRLGDGDLAGLATVSADPTCLQAPPARNLVAVTPRRR